MSQAKTRTKVMPQRVTGRIADWKGKFGWIQPDKPITHPEAKMHKGQVYLSQMDVESEISGVGAHVSFFVYADGSGLGAMNCRPAGAAGVTVQPTVQKPVTVPKPGQQQQQQAGGKAGKPVTMVQPVGPKGKPATSWQGKPASAQAFSAAASRQTTPTAPGQKKRVSNARISGQVKAWKGGFGWIVPTEAVNHPLYRGQIYVKASDVKGGVALEPGMPVSFFLYTDSQGLGAEDCTAADGSGEAGARTVPAHVQKAGAKGGQAGAKGGQVAPGPRERLTVVPTTGEVAAWKGAFGFITPHEVVDHPQASKREGKIYIAKKDIEGGATSLEVGQLVQFHVFVDNTGLGAEECMPF